MTITFERRKKDVLGKIDKSSIGGVDKPIQKLCDKINNLENFYTLSSCSGRIVLIKNLEKKQPGMFIFRSHSKVSFNELKNILKKAKSNIMFKQEPPILHVCCACLEDAEKLLGKARDTGWKNSGIITSRKRIVVELRSTEYLALPIIEKGEILVSDKFLKILLTESNKRLLRGWQKINKLIDLS